MFNFRPFNHEIALPLPPTVQECVPEGHLARYIVEIVNSLDLSVIENAYSGRGSAAYAPKVMLSLLIYSYATGLFSSRKIEAATYDSLAFRYIACNDHPDHDTLNHFRNRFGDEFSSVFVQVLAIAKESKVSRFGSVSLDGTKVHADASRHSALSYGHAQKMEAQLKAEVSELMALADEANRHARPLGMDLPEELQRREDRLQVLNEAKAKIEARAADRFAQEQADYEAKMVARQIKEADTSKKPGGSEPKAPVDTGPLAKDQINLTDEESRIMHQASGGFEQSYNAQAVVDTESMLIMVAFVTQAVNDKKQVAPALAGLQALPETIPRPTTLLGDAGYYSEQNVNSCHEFGITPLIATGRESHHPHWSERFGDDPPPLEKEEAATPVEEMKHQLKTQEGKALYALRKQTVEPVFGIIKSVMGFRQFSVRGLKKVQNEWNLVCLAWNVKRLAVLCP